MTHNFSEYSEFYDLLYSDKDYEAEVAYFLGLLKSHSNVPHRRVLEFGAGTGAHQAFFSKYGLDSLGVELSPEMVNRAKARGLNVTEGDFRSFRYPEKFDAVLALFHVLGYLSSESELTSCFETAANHLDSGGLFIFDFWFRDAVLSQKPELRIKRVSSEDFVVCRIAEPRMIEKDNSVEVQYSIFSKKKNESFWTMQQELHQMRYFSREDIELLSQANGFRLVSMEETLTGIKPTHKTWNVTACLEKA